MALDIFPVDGPWPGRLAVCARPRSGTWMLDDVRALKGTGYDVLVSAITPRELRELHLDRLGAACGEHGIEHVQFPIGNMQVPPLDNVLPMLDRWDRALAEGRGIAFHCYGSVGRSPMLAAALLVRGGVHPEIAWERLTRSRGRDVPDTLEQRRWVDGMAAGIDIHAALE